MIQLPVNQKCLQKNSSTNSSTPIKKSLQIINPQGLAESESGTTCTTYFFTDFYRFLLRALNIRCLNTMIQLSVLQEE